MKNPAHASWRRVLFGGAISAILFGGIAIGSLTRAQPRISEVETGAVAAGDGNSGRCAECGFIQSTTDSRVGNTTIPPGPKTRGMKRAIDPPVAQHREIVIRMRDGSTMVITEPNLGNWKVGERVKVLAGVER